MRWDHLGASGNPWIRTPNLDRLAAQSVVFEKVYTGSFPTIPHRTDMITGKWVYPYRSWTPLPEDETIVGELLTEAGYVTMLIADTPHLLRDGHRFDRGLTGWKWNRGQEGDRAITDALDVRLPSAPEKIRGPERMRANHYRWRQRHWQTERDTFAARTFQDAADWIELNHVHDKFFLWVDCFDRTSRGIRCSTTSTCTIPATRASCSTIHRTPAAKRSAPPRRRSATPAPCTPAR